MRKVKEANNPYCGPAVLSILTGKDTDTCARIFEDVTGRYDIKEVFTHEILAALKRLKFNVEKVNSDCSLFSLFHQIANTNGMYVVVVPAHVVAVEVKDRKIYFCDNHTKEPINGAASARLGQYVVECYRTEAKPEPVFVCSKLRVISSTFGISTIYIYRDNYYVDSSDDESVVLGSISASGIQEMKEIRDLLLAKV